MTEVLNQTAQTAPELLALCNLAVETQDYATAFTYASMAYRAARGNIEQHRADPTIACDAARHACWLSALLNSSEASTAAWVDDGISALGDPKSTENVRNIEVRIRLYETGIEAMKLHNTRRPLATEHFHSLQRFHNEARFWRQKLREPYRILHFLG